MSLRCNENRSRGRLFQPSLIPPFYRLDKMRAFQGRNALLIFSKQCCINRALWDGFFHITVPFNSGSTKTHLSTNTFQNRKILDFSYIITGRFGQKPGDHGKSLQFATKMIMNCDEKQLNNVLVVLAHNLQHKTGNFRHKSEK